MTRNTKGWLGCIALSVLWGITGNPSEACSFLAAAMVIAAIDN